MLRVIKARSTLLTSPRSQADFAVRLVFFAFAPIAIVFAAALFPVVGTLLSVALTLVVLLLGEAVRARATRWPWLGRAFARALALEAYYRLRPPRPFMYYALYPLLFPYWLVNTEARREFLLFKGYTLTSVLVLLASVVAQYFLFWQPELGIGAYLPVVGVTLAIELVLVLALLMPIATTVIGLHQSFRRGRLVALLVVGLGSTTLAIMRLERRRDPIVSFATRERVFLRTRAAPKRARDVQITALRASWKHSQALAAAVEGDGKVEGEPLDAAHEALERFYKPDEAYAFDLWASPRRNPEILVLYFEARRKRDPIWIALKRNGDEVRDAKQLPRGAFVAMRHAAE
jgi:hypothetical protein